jgi:hypothetical protein
MSKDSSENKELTDKLKSAIEERRSDLANEAERIDTMFQDSAYNADLFDKTTTSKPEHQKFLVQSNIDMLIQTRDYNAVDEVDVYTLVQKKLLENKEPYISIRANLGESGLADINKDLEDKILNTLSPEEQILSTLSPKEKGELLIEYLLKEDKQKAIECLEAGAAVNIKHESGLTPLSIATGLGHEFFDIAITLVNKGAEIHPNNVGFFIAGDRKPDQSLLTKLLLASKDEKEIKTLEGMRVANGMEFTEKSQLHKILTENSTDDLARKFAAHTPDKNAKSEKGFDVDLILDNCPLALIKKLDEIDKKLSTPIQSKPKPTLYESVTNAISTIINYIVSPFIGKDQDMQKVLAEFSAVSKEREKEHQPSKRLSAIDEILAKGKKEEGQSFAQQLKENTASQVRGI